MLDLGDTDAVLREYDVIRLMDAATIGLRGEREGQIDPLAVLLDPAFTETAWFYEHSKTEPTIPGNLHPKQLEALGADARHRLLLWGNQTGKTTVGAVDMALLALGRHPHQKWEPPIVGWASALTWDLWETIMLPELLTWLPPDRVLDAPEARAKSMKRTILVRADNGSVSRIVGKSAEQGSAKYQSARVHRVWLDEEHPESVWNELLPRLLRFGGDTLTTATPLLGLTWLYYRLYQGWKAGTEDGVWVSHAGLADNPSITAAAIAALEHELQADPAQLAARLYGHFAQPSGIAIQFDPNRDLETWTPGMMEVVQEKAWTHLCGIDFGYWRFAFVHLVVDRAGRGHVVREVFGQKWGATERAKAVHEHLTHWKAPRQTRIWGDAANPTDILEMNRELMRIESPYRVAPVEAENKARAASVTLLNSLFARQALILRRDLGDGQKWRLGQSAASDGVPQVGSRLRYEIGAWRYPEPKDGQAQKQDPDDHTADGADMIAALRYAVMSHYRPAKFDAPPVRTDPDFRGDQLAKLMERLNKGQNKGKRDPRRAFG